MTDEQIKKILMETQDYVLSRLPKTEWDYEFSPKFRRNMNRLIARDKHRVMYTLIRAVAIFFLVVCVPCGLILGFNQEVRANVIQWMAERFTQNEFKYRNGFGKSEDITAYTMERFAPKGYWLAERTEEENRVSEIYTKDNGDILFFTVMTATYDGEFYVVSDEREPNDRAYFGEIEADLYISQNPKDPSVIVWHGEAGKLFVIQGIMTKDQIIELAEEIYKAR